jgi:DNA (cytosine-5)-methyltransferase 1
MWPEITHMDGAANLMGYKPWRPSREIIDWSIPGTSIFDRKRPLAEATMRRIAVGIEKYWKDYAKPFIAVLYGTNDVRTLDLPLPTVTTSGNHHALIEPFIASICHSSARDRSRSIDEPISTVVGKQEHCLIEPVLLGRQSCAAARPVSQPVPTVATAGAISLVEPLVVEYHGTSRPYPVSLPIKTITTKDRFALMEPSIGTRLDIRFRMLKNHELKMAQGFPANYKITGNVTEQTKQIGNAVPVNTAKALALAAMGAQTKMIWGGV